MQVEANLGISVQERKTGPSDYSGLGECNSLPRSRNLPSLTAIEGKRACKAGRVFVELVSLAPACGR
jgi:hypothetical protein